MIFGNYFELPKKTQLSVSICAVRFNSQLPQRGCLTGTPRVVTLHHCAQRKKRFYILFVFIPREENYGRHFH